MDKNPFCAWSPEIEKIDPMRGTVAPYEVASRMNDLGGQIIIYMYVLVITLGFGLPGLGIGRIFFLY